MENEYGITVANKYALFLCEDEDSLEILKLQQDSKKKADKTKKSASKEKEGKPIAVKQNASSTAGQEKKSEKVDQFSSPTVASEPVLKSVAPSTNTGVVSTGSTEGFSESVRGRPNRENRGKPRSNTPREFRENRDHTGDEGRNSEPIHDNRPPRIRDRGGRPYRQDRGGFRENRPFRPDSEVTPGDNADKVDKPNSIGFFDSRERRPPRNGFTDQPPRLSRDRFGNERTEHSGGFGDRSDRDGFGGGRGSGYYPRRGGYRGRGRGDRNQFSERSDVEHTGFDDGQTGVEAKPAREGFSDNDGGNFMERPERDGFGQRRDFRGRRGGSGRGRGNFDRPPRREYQQRYGDRTDRRPRQSETEGEPASDEVKTLPADGGDIQSAQLEKTPEVATSSWAEQIDAADQEAKKENLGGEDGDDDAMGEGAGEPKVMTLDEWKACEDAKRVKAEFNIRKPGEGYNTDPQWKKMFVLSKKERPDEHDEDEEQEEEEHHSKARNVLPIEIHFADDSVRGARGRGSGRRGGMGGPRGRGGRGGGRGGGRWESDDYRGEPRGESSQGSRGGYNETRTYVRSNRGTGGGRRERTPNFNDESDFPSLGTSVPQP